MNNTPHQLTDNVKLLQKVAIVHDGKVLIVKRHPDSLSRPNCWDLPGGNSEWPSEDETGHGQLRKDAIREVMEETALQLSEVDFPSTNIVFADTFFNGSVFTMILGWKVNAEKIEQEVTLSHEHTEFAWIGKENLEKYDFGGERGLFVREIIESSL